MSNVKSVVEPKAPAVARLPAVKWDLLAPLLRCPGCESHALDLRLDAVVCKGCGRSYVVDGGIIDFIGDAATETPAFYSDPYYRRFMESISALHAAHYEEGSFSRGIEDRVKKDLFKLVKPSNEVSVDLGCGLGNGFPLIGPEDKIIGVDAEVVLLKETQSRFPNSSLFRANLGALPFRTGSLHRVFANAVLEHVFYIESALAHIQRSLAADGVFYVAIPTEGSLAVDIARLYTSSRNAKLIGLKPSESRIAQRKDHCNTVFLLENMFRKFFTTERSSMWPFGFGSVHMNLSRSYALRPLEPQ
jgi:SAM-dependent methyltransferase